MAGASCMAALRGRAEAEEEGLNPWTRLVADAAQLGVGVLAVQRVAGGQPRLAARLRAGDDLLQVCTVFTTSPPLNLLTAVHVLTFESSDGPSQ